MILACILGYLLGSIPFGKLFSFIGGVDIQKRGSGNIGFANVQRILGWKYSVPTLFFDISKGLAATLIGFSINGSLIDAFIVGYCAMLGHIFPIWLKFKGGKGIATGVGLLAVLAPIAALISSAIYTSLRLFKTPSSTASLWGVAIASVGLIITEPSLWWIALILAITATATLHRNLRGTVPDYG